MAGSVTHPTPVKHRSRGVVRISVAVTTDASGDAPLTPVGVAYGRLVGVLYDGGLDASASITLKDAKTGAILFGPYVTGTEGTPVALRPTTNVVTVAGATIAAADTAPNIWRAIKAAGRVSVLVSAGGNAETCKVAFIFDEANIGDLALTV